MVRLASSINLSNTCIGGVGRAGCFLRTSQFRVKDGMIRPPMTVIIIIEVAKPNRIPVPLSA